MTVLEGHISTLAETELHCCCDAQVPTRVRQAPREWLGFPGSWPGHARGRPCESNVKVLQSTGALLKMPGRPQQGFPDSGGGHAPREAMPWLSYPGAYTTILGHHELGNSGTPVLLLPAACR